MKFRRKSDGVIVTAKQLTEKTIYNVLGPKEEITADVGDWEITYRQADGNVHLGLCAADEFEKAYEPLDIDEEVALDAAEAMTAHEIHEASEQAKVNNFIDQCKTQRLPVV